MAEDEAGDGAVAAPKRPSPRPDTAPVPASRPTEPSPSGADGKADGRGTRAERKAAKRAAKAERKAAKRAAKAERKAAKRAADTERRTAKRATAEPAPAGHADAHEANPAADTTTSPTTSGTTPQGATAVLEEVADLMRRAAQPAPAHVVVRREEPGDAEWSPGRSVTAGARAVIAAAVDVGANSVHLLVAAAGGHRVEPLLDESVFLGLGDRVARDGYMGEAARAELVHALAGYVATARRMGARDIVLLGTEPVRRALDAAALARETEARSGVGLHVIDHDEEAMLMLLGVTMGRPVRVETLVVDIGGGSCEFVITGPGRPVTSAGLRLGCASLTQDAGAEDPPTAEEVEAMRRVARETVIGAPDASPSEIVAVGGTASNMLRLLPAAALDRVLSRRRMEQALGLVMQETSLDAAGRHLLRPQRARILPAGIVIADAILERYGAKRLRVSEEGIREGAVLAAAAFGSAWRDQLPVLVAGWPDVPSDPD